MKQVTRNVFKRINKICKENFEERFMKKML